MNENASPSRHPCVAVTTQAPSGSAGHGAGVGVVGASVVGTGVVCAAVGCAGVVGAGVGAAEVLTESTGVTELGGTGAGAVVVASLGADVEVLVVPAPQPESKSEGLTASKAMAARAIGLGDMADTLVIGCWVRATED